MPEPTWTLTLNEIRDHSPCKSGWEKLLVRLGKTKADDEPLHLSVILESNGLDDALWAARALSEDHHSALRLFAADCAERALPIFERERPGDTRPRRAIEAARAFARGEIERKELRAAERAAEAASWDVSGAAVKVAVAAWTAAGADAWDAAADAASAAAGVAVLDVARAAERAWREEQFRKTITGSA